MSLKELLKTTEYVVDADGKKKAVVVNWAAWEELLTMLEDLEDSEEVEQLRKAKQEYVSWQRAKSELRSAGIDI